MKRFLMCGIAAGIFAGGWVVGTTTQTLHAKYIADAEETKFRGIMTSISALNRTGEDRRRDHGRHNSDRSSSKGTIRIDMK